MLKNFTFFDAPHVAIVTTDVNQGLYGAADCGAYVANLLNIAHAAGVATIPQAAIAMQSPTVRRVLDLPEAHGSSVASPSGDRKSVVYGKSVAVRLNPGGRRLIQK